mmetsp:Transcript_4063/g.7199  ORF Transcript_4063/g.7199 Transcript_4063/m.7199 type:complete len:120 (+) Transcript_4063:1146-1505(+)
MSHSPSTMKSIKSHRHTLRRDYDADDEVNRLAYQLTHRPMHMACTFAHPTTKGLSIVHNACVKTFIPIAPPGRNVTRYHNSANSCSADAPSTKRYPCAPPTVNVKYSVIIIDPKYTTVK